MAFIQVHTSFLLTMHNPASAMWNYSKMQQSQKISQEMQQSQENIRHQIRKMIIMSMRKVISVWMSQQVACSLKASKEHADDL